MRRLVIAGRRGGVGRTTAAVNLAIAAARTGSRVLLVDAERSQAAVAALNLDSQAGHVEDAALAGTRWWRDAVPLLDVVTTTENATVADLMRELEREPLRSHYQWAIIDAPIGTAVEDADALLWVVRGEAAMAKTLSADLARVGANGQASVLLMMPARASATVESELRDLCGSTMRVATLPFDAAVGRSLLMGRPVLDAHPQAPVSLALRALAAQLGLTKEPATPDWPAAEPIAIPDHIVPAAIEPETVPTVVETVHELQPTTLPEFLVPEASPEAQAESFEPPPLPITELAQLAESNFVDLPEPIAPETSPASLVESFVPPPLPVIELVRPAESDFVDLPKPPVVEPPSGITGETETITSPDTPESHSMWANPPQPGQDLGFQVEYDAMADGSAWTAPHVDMVEILNAGFAGASTENLYGPPVPQPLEVPFGVVRDERDSSRQPMNQPSLSFVAHGVELNAPQAAIHGQSCKEEETDRFWGPTQEKPAAVAPAIEGHTGDLSAVAFSPDGRQVLTASWDKTVRVWWSKDGTTITKLKGHTGVVSALAFAPDGDTLVTGSWDKTVRLWDAITFTERRCLSGHTGVVMAVAASSDGRSFASAGWDKTVRIWNGDNDHCQVLTGHTRMVTGVAFNPDGKWLASASWDKTIRLWDATTGELIRTMTGHSGDVTGLVWLSDNRIVSVAQDHTAIIWNANDGTVMHTLTGHSGEVNVVAATLDSTLVATAGWDKSIRVWDAATGDARAVLSGHTAVVSGLAFEPHGPRLASVSHDRTLRLWNISTHHEISTFTIQSGPATTTEVLLSDGDTGAVEQPSPPSLLKGGSSDAVDATAESTPTGPKGGRSTVAPDMESIFAPDADDPPPPSGIIGAAPPTPLPVKLPALRQGGTLCALAVAGGSGIVAAGAGDGLVLLWDLATGADAGVLRGHPGAVAALTFAPGGRVLASGGDDCVVRLWDVASARERLCLTGHEAPISALVVNVEGNILISADVNGEIKLWDLAAGSVLHSLRQPGGTLSLAIACDGEKLAAGGRDGSIRVWNIATMQELSVLRCYGRDVNALAFTSDARTLASGGPDGVVRFWETASWKEWNNLEAHNQPITSVTFSPNGQLLATASKDTTARLWDCISGQLLHDLVGHAEPIVAAAFAADNFTLCTASQDQTVRSWYTDTGKMHGLLCQASDSVTGDGTGIDFGIPAEPSAITTLRWRLAAGASDSRIRLWDFGDNHRIWESPSAVLEGHTLDVNGVAFSPDGSLLASSSGDTTVRLWNVRNGQLLKKLEGHAGEVAASAFSPDGALLATGSWDTMIRLWDIATKKEAGTLRGHVGAVTSVAFHPAGRLLASAGWDKNVLLWDLANKKTYGTLSGHEKMVTAVAFAPDGKTIVTGGWDKTARLWNPDTGRCVRTLTGHRFAVSAVAVHPDGKTLATGSWDTVVKLWDMESGQEIRTLYGHTESIRSVAFMPDGSLIASGSWDGTLRIWDVTTGEERAIIKLPGFKFHTIAFTEVRKRK